VRRISEAADADTVVFDDELTPAQQRNLEQILGRTAIDRAAVILDIFAQNAHTEEGRAQVELALLQYRLPRLRGRGLTLSQQAGRIGTRGPARRSSRWTAGASCARIRKLEVDLRDLERTRRTQRRSRTRGAYRQVSFVGYTNAGKSTLLNYLTNADVLVENRLFSTLDPARGASNCPGARWCCARTRWVSCESCPTSWWMPSMPLWRSSPPLICSCTSSTDRPPIRSGR